jgi:hypothetical protein
MPTDYPKTREVTGTIRKDNRIFDHCPVGRELHLNLGRVPIKIILTKEEKL